MYMQEIQACVYVVRQGKWTGCAWLEAAGPVALKNSGAAHLC